MTAMACVMSVVMGMMAETGFCFLRLRRRIGYCIPWKGFFL